MMRPGKIRWWHAFPWVRKHGRLVLCLLVLPLIAFLVYSLSLFNIGGVSSSVEQVYLRFVTHTTQKTVSNRIRLIYMDATDNAGLLNKYPELQGSIKQKNLQPWRKLDAELISKLAKAQVAVVAFDFTFPQAKRGAKAANRAFVNAVRKAGEHSRTRIVVGAEPGESIDPDLSQVSSLAYGNIKIREQITGADNSKAFQVALAYSDGPAANGMVQDRPERLMGMPLLLYTCAQWPGKRSISYRLDVARSEVTLAEKGNPVHHFHTEMGICNKGAPNCTVPGDFEWRRMALVPLVMPAINKEQEESFESVLEKQDLPDYKNKIVIVGARLASDEYAMPRWESKSDVYGYEIHAAILSDLLNDTYPRYPGSLSQLLIFFLIAGTAVLGRRWLPVKDIKINTIVFGERQVPSGLLVLILIYAIIGVVAYSVHYLVLNVAYDLALLVAAYFTYGSKSPGTAEPAK